jgi:catechol 2,3-dioxygenase-like lactoylglutathione lyase family enzyme
MHLGSIYLIVNDFDKSIWFYENLLQIPVTKKNMDRFAMFNFDGQCIALMNGHFDSENPGKVIHKGEYSEYFDDLKSIATASNSHKVVLNFWDENLQKEYDRLRSLQLTDNITRIKYICNVSPYYYFHLTDPDGNIIEVTGEYTPRSGEFDD